MPRKNDARCRVGELLTASLVAQLVGRDVTAVTAAARTGTLPGCYRVTNGRRTAFWAFTTEGADAVLQHFGGARGRA